MLGIFRTNDPHDALALNDFTTDTQFFDRCPNFQNGLSRVIIYIDTRYVPAINRRGKVR